MANGDDDEDENTARHDAILRVGAEFYERGARATRDRASVRRISHVSERDGRGHVG